MAPARLGRRVMKAVGSTGATKTRFIYNGPDSPSLKDGWQCIEEYEGTGSTLTLTRTYVYGNNIDEALQVKIGNDKYYYHTNAQGNVAAITNNAGAVVETFKYDIYGRLTGAEAWNGSAKVAVIDGDFDGNGTIDTGATADGFVDREYLARSVIDNSALFQGRNYDAESGLYYFRNRQYDPIHGRFLSRDPMAYHDSYSLYQFVNNNPVCYTDPLGNYIGIESSKDDTQETKQKFIDDAIKLMSAVCDKGACKEEITGDAHCTVKKCKEEARELAEAYIDRFYQVAQWDQNESTGAGKDVRKGYVCYEWTYIIKMTLQRLAKDFSCWKVDHVGIIVRDSNDNNKEKLRHNYVIAHLGTLWSGDSRDYSVIMDAWSNGGQPETYTGLSRTHFWNWIHQGYEKEVGGHYEPSEYDQRGIRSKNDYWQPSDWHYDPATQRSLKPEVPE